MSALLCDIVLGVDVSFKSSLRHRRLLEFLCHLADMLAMFGGFISGTLLRARRAAVSPKWRRPIRDGLVG